METRISSISQLDEVSTLRPDDLFVVSEPATYTTGVDYTNTGYVSKKLSFDKFSDYLSVLVIQDLVNKISNISGNVYTYTSTLNYVTGTLIQNINTQISHVSGDVNVSLSALNHVSGDLVQNLSTQIANVSGNVSSVNKLETNVNAINAHISNTIDVELDNVVGDVYSDAGIMNSLSAVQAYVYDEIQVTLSDILGDVYSPIGISNMVNAISADVYNKIDLELNNITGNVKIEGGIYNFVSSTNTTITNIINDINELCAAMHYPIVYLNDAIDGNDIVDYVLQDKSVNVINLIDDTPCNITFESFVTHDDDKKYSRDFELVVYTNALPNITWDKSVRYMSPDDADILTSFDLAMTYIFYFSEIDENVFYVSRQELNDITSEVVGD